MEVPPVQDRRGFEPLFVLGFVLTLIGQGWIVLYGNVWMCVGLSGLGAIICITTERTSRPPPNDPAHFVKFRHEQPTEQKKQQPVLVCLGDSLTHGRCSANVVDSINPKLKERLGLAASAAPNAFSSQSPLWVVNAGQNNICSWTVLQERVDRVLACGPDYVIVWIGSNDLRSIYKKSWSRQMVNMWRLPREPSFAELEQNLNSILSRLFSREQTDSAKNQPKRSNIKHVGVCTLPPMGEDLTHPANQLVKRANAIVEKVVAKHFSNKDNVQCSVIPVYEALERHILQHESQPKRCVPVDYFLLLSPIMGVLYHVVGVSWNKSSSWIGNRVLSDSLHLNESGRDLVVATIVEWLIKIGIEKSMKTKTLVAPDNS